MVTLTLWLAMVCAGRHEPDCSLIAERTDQYGVYVCDEGCMSSIVKNVRTRLEAPVTELADGPGPDLKHMTLISPVVSFNTKGWRLEIRHKDAKTVRSNAGQVQEGGNVRQSGEE